MLRLTEIKLPLDHSESALADCILDRLAIEADQLVRYAIYRRGVDARRRSAIAFIYTLDVEVADEPALFKRLANRRHIEEALRGKGPPVPHGDPGNRGARQIHQ